MVHTRRGICAGVWVTVPMLVVLAFILTSPLTPTHAAEGQAKVDRLVMGVINPYHDRSYWIPGS
jgi:hypothetical protein